MDWTIEEGYGIPIGTPCYMSYPKEVSLVSFYLTPQPLYAQAALSPSAAGLRQRCTAAG